MSKDDKPTVRIEFYQDMIEEWRWKLLAKNGKIVAASSEGFHSRWNAKRNLKKFIKSVTTYSGGTHEITRLR